LKQVLIRQGKAVVEQVPVPQLEAGTVLVQVDHSCISIGTELSGLKMSGAPLWKRALKQPENVKKVLQMVASSGLSRTRSVVSGRLAAGTPTGYSAAGTVLKVGEGISDLQPGDRVACAGAQCAHHAEFICVPRNLTVLIPDTLAFAEASTVTLGAIAMQGVRRASPTLGETFVVIGLGILGQLVAQTLKANGCRVVGIDLDVTRIQLAKTLGMDIGILPEHGDNIEQVFRYTDGIGADGVIITAATPSDEVISTAFKMCRKKGRVVLVGDVGLNLNRSDFYQKEIDLFISSSYGPGRYDHHYEEQGLDYPVAYVRWTENRNMTEYLRLIAENKIKVTPLIKATYPIEAATEAYQALENTDHKPLMVLLQYAQQQERRDRCTVANLQARATSSQHIRLAIVGAGGFAKGMHLPNIEKLSDRYHIQAIVSRSGHNAIATAKQFGANYGTTDYQQTLLDPDVDAVLIATRHHLHTEMVLQALQAGKHVMVEKPLACNESDLEKIMAFYEQANSQNNLPLLLTGFNRRFSKFLQRSREIVALRSNPMIINYHMNAGYIPLDHWVHGAEGKGRNIGEACHIYDLFTYLTNSQVLSVQTQSITPKTAYYASQDNFVTSMTFEDGSIATLTYTALGTKDYPKEQMEIYVDGKVLTLTDYKSLKIYGAKIKDLETKTSEKGQREEMIAFADAIQKGGDWPIPLWQQIQATQISFQVERALNPYQQD
jgi:predicted dehydrogenase/threonine dehydrogenase-like Zn-dependent dehydrogenase